MAYSWAPLFDWRERELADDYRQLFNVPMDGTVANANIPNPIMDRWRREEHREKRLAYIREQNKK